MNKAVFLFSGQGAQKVGMGKDLYEAYPEVQEMFDRADEILGRRLTQIMFEGPEEELTKTANCQPALFLHGLALKVVLEKHRPDLEMVATAGLSLGEMTAHTAAGSFDFEEGLKIVARRGELMDEACSQTEGGMAAMIGGDEAAVKELAVACDVDVANFNAPGQIVLSGNVAGIEKAVAGAKEKGIRMAKPLKVAGAYHSRLMVSAEEKLAKALSEVIPHQPKVPVICNFSAQSVSSAEEIRETLTRQVTGSVRWTESMQLLRNEGHELFIELGPGKVLTGLMGRIDKAAKVLAIEDDASLRVALESL